MIRCSGRYLFQQMFGEFRGMFLGVCNGHAAVAVIGLSVRYPNHPVMLWAVAVAAYCVFKPASSLVELGFWLPTMLILSPCLHKMKARRSRRLAQPATSCNSLLRWPL